MTGAAGAAVVLGREELAAVVSGLGAQISAEHPEGVVVVGVLKAAVFFVADLVRHVTAPCAVDFLAVSAYRPGSGRVRILKDLDADVAGQAVVLAETIVDTGLTCGYLRGELERRGPASVEVCALVDRPARRIVPVPLRYVGVRTEEDLLVGYGLDVAGRYRNLPVVASADRRGLVEDPDACVDALYGR